MVAAKVFDQHFGKGSFTRTAHSEVTHANGYDVGELGSFEIAIVKEFVPNVEKQTEQTRSEVCKQFQQGIDSLVSKVQQFMQTAKFYRHFSHLLHFRRVISGKHNHKRANHTASCRALRDRQPYLRELLS